MTKTDVAIAVAIFLGVGGILGTARADGDYFPPVSHDLTRTECSECHMAYPPGLLPAASWQAIMGSLSDHFGEDASLAPEAVTEITGYLVANAGGPRRGDDPAHPAPRISEAPWFQREHRARTFEWAQTTPTIGSISNCAGCHRSAERGYFEDD